MRRRPQQRTSRGRSRRGAMSSRSSTSSSRIVLNSIDWARHRVRKAAAKLHMNDLPGNLLPSFAIVEDAGHHDSKRAEAVTASLGDGDVLVADRAYTDFGFLNALALRNVFFVVREKTDLVMEALEALQGPVEFNADSKATQILGDEIVRPSRKGTAGKYTAGDGTLRRVTAMIEVRGQMRRMVGEAQHRPASRNVWDGRRVEIGRDQAEAPAFAGFSAFLAVSNGTASRQIPGDSGTWSRLSENLSRNFIP